MYLFIEWRWWTFNLKKESEREETFPVTTEADIIDALDQWTEEIARERRERVGKGQCLRITFEGRIG